MADATRAATGGMLVTPGGLRITRLQHGGLKRIDAAGVCITLFPGHEAEAPLANLWLRHHLDDRCEVLRLLGPDALLQPLQAELGNGAGTASDRLAWTGRWRDVTLDLLLRAVDLQAPPADLDPDLDTPVASAWYWHLLLTRDPAEVAATDAPDGAAGPPAPLSIDLVLLQDVALANYVVLRSNEHLVSHFVELTPLSHARCGRVLAVRQKLSQQGRHPWALAGSLRLGVACATDALQVLGRAHRAGDTPVALLDGLPDERQQHEHAMVALQDDALTLAAGATATAGFFMAVWPDREAAGSGAEPDHVAMLLDRPEAQPEPAFAALRELRQLRQLQPAPRDPVAQPAPARFANAAWFEATELGDAQLLALFGSERRQAEYDDNDRLLSFFAGPQRHVVLLDKELQVLRPHGHLLRSGRHEVPDESALTSTVWMSGVFHSMVTQGRVSNNRLLSTVRGYLGQFRSHGLRLFVRLAATDAPAVAGPWQQLGLPSAFVIQPGACFWFYRHPRGLFVVRSGVEHDPHALTLRIDTLDGPPPQWRATLHLALDGDGGLRGLPVPWRREGFGPADRLRVMVPANSALGRRFPRGSFTIEPLDVRQPFEHLGGEGWLLADGNPDVNDAPAGADAESGETAAGLPFVVVGAAAATVNGLRLRSALLPQGIDARTGAATPESTAGAALAIEPGGPLPLLKLAPGIADLPQRRQIEQLAEMLPWWRHDALVHYLSPRGLELRNAGEWVTREVCQGPLELMLALDNAAPVREMLLRVFAAQHADGDWPQRFDYFDHDRIDGGEASPPDLVFRPLLGLARYLLASGDESLLGETPSRSAAAAGAPQAGTVWQGVERALALIARRKAGGTSLVTGDMQDWSGAAKQTSAAGEASPAAPPDPAPIEHGCSAWLVALQYRTLRTLARALRAIDRAAAAIPIDDEAAAVRADFQRLMVVDGRVCAALLLPPGQPPRPLLRPFGEAIETSISLLAAMNVLPEDLLTPPQVRAHFDGVCDALAGVDTARLFDQPPTRRDGAAPLLAQAEGAAAIGHALALFDPHAHLRWAETLAHLGQARALLDALSLVHPVGLHERLPAASPRQSNAYYSGSGTLFGAPFNAHNEARSERASPAEQNAAALEGGWRVYSSGPGIAIGIVVGRLLGLRREARQVVFDPVLAPELNGLSARVALVDGREIQLVVRLWPLVREPQGHGPQHLTIDGTELPFTREPNPYRLGGAIVDAQLLRRHLAAGARRLEIWLG